MAEIYSCPTCRKPLFVARHESEANLNTQEISVEERRARHMSAGLDWPNTGRHAMAAGLYHNQTRDSVEGVHWRFKFLYHVLSI